VPTTPGEECEDDGAGDGTGADDPHAATPRIIPVTAMANSAGLTWDDFDGCKRMVDPPQGDNIIACAVSGAQEPPAAISMDCGNEIFQARDCAGHPEWILPAGGQTLFREQDGGIAA
jgi:hypothetical protein